MDWKNICGKCEKHGCCCGVEPVYVTRQEEETIKKATRIKNLTINNYLRKKNKKCIFLKNGFCGIQSIKPLDCKAWPIVFWSDGGDGEISYFLDLDCVEALNLSKKDIARLKRVVEQQIKKWTKEDLYKYDICAYWKPEKINKNYKKDRAYPFGVGK
ncbi:MAG: YkgJ family cysteine cluster protein [Candidatus Diapherotrites archaeon]